MERQRRVVTTREAAALMDLPERTVLHYCKAGKIAATSRSCNGGVEYTVFLDELPEEARNRYLVLNTPPEIQAVVSAGDLYAYNEAPEYARRKADKYLDIMRRVGDLRGERLKSFLKTWSEEHPDRAVSYASYRRAVDKYSKFGINGLLGQWGKKKGRTSITEEWYESFKSFYMKEGAPSLRSCWEETLGVALAKEPELDIKAFPTGQTFRRLLGTRVPKDAIFLARHGYQAWERRYGYQIERDYSNLLAGQCWVSDHAQIDVAVTYTHQGKTKMAFPWLTSWIDNKTQKFLGWDLHVEAPNSDHIFLSFGRAAAKYGVPAEIYIDNGKDYRCRAFSGGRKSWKFEMGDQGHQKAVSMTALLGITTHFSIVRNAQSKIIERVHLNIKEWVSKHYVGYRGGNVVERPERLAKEIKAGNLMPFEEFVKVFDKAITEIMNRNPINNETHNGMCADELWEQELPNSIKAGQVRKVSADTLRFFCSRTSNILTIGKNGVRDSELGVTYWDEWMMASKGKKVRLKRDPKHYEVASVHDAQDGSFIGNARLFSKVSALAETEVEKADLKEAMRLKNLQKKIAKSYADPGNELSFEEKMAARARAIQAINEGRGYVPSEDNPMDNASILVTQADHWARKEEEMEKRGGHDPIPFAPKEKEEEEGDRKLWFHEVNVC